MLRAEIERRLASPKADRATAEAAILRLMDRAYLRVGSKRFAEREDSPSFGASSLRKEHVRLSGDRISIEFPGKSGVHWKKTLRDPELARALELFLALPGERIFQAPGPGGRLFPVTERHIRDVMTSYEAVPKDLRTFHANRLFLENLADLARPRTDAEADANIKRAIESAAAELRHTPKVFESSYLDPANKDDYKKTGRAGRGPP